MGFLNMKRASSLANLKQDMAPISSRLSVVNEETSMYTNNLNNTSKILPQIPTSTLSID